MKKQAKSRENRMLVFLCCALFLTMLVALLAPSPAHNDSLFFNTDAPLSLSGWQQRLPDGTLRPVSVPTKLTDLPDGPYTLVSRLPQKLMPGASLCVRASMQSLSVAIDGETVYTYGEAAVARGRAPGSLWCLTRLPEDSAGKEISITLDSPFAAFHGLVNPVLLGSKSSLLFYFLRHYGLGLLVSCGVMLIGVVLITIYALFRLAPLRDRRLLYLALFAMTASLWLAGESRMLQFFTGNWYLITNLSYLALMAFPLPLVLFVNTAYTPHHRRFIHLLGHAFAVNLAVQVVVQLAGFSDYFSMLPATHGLFIFSMVSVTMSLLYETLRHQNKEAREALASLGILFFFGLLAFISFLLGKFDALAPYTSLGIFFFILLLSIFTTRRFVAYTRKAREARYFEQLAFQDLLTQGKNRHAYDQDCRRYFSLDGASPGCWLLLFDLDKLKVINDTNGHLAGDEALRAAYRCIVRAFNAPDTSYRIGGDEFACILPRATRADVLTGLVRLRLLVAEEDARTEYPFSVAVGYGQFDPRKWSSFAAFTNHVDDHMYIDKQLNSGSPHSAQ